MTTPAPSVVNLSYAEDGIRVAWISNDALLRVWDGTRVLEPVKLPSARHIAFGTTLIAVTDQTHPLVRFVHTGHMSLLPRPQPPQGTGAAVAITTPRLSEGAASRVDGLVAFADAASVRVQSYAGESVSVFNAASVVFSAAFGAAGRALATGDSKGVVRVWDVAQPAAVCVAVLQGHRSFVSSLSFDARGARLLSGSWDGRVHVWDLRTPRKPPAWSVRAEAKGQGKVHAVCVPGLRGEKGVVAAAGSGGTVRVWRTVGDDDGSQAAVDLEPIAVHSAHSSAVYCLSFSPDGRHIASGSADGTVRIFGVPTKPLLISHVGSGMDSAATNRPSVDTEGQYVIQPMDMIIKGQRADRQLIFCPSTVVTLSCPICSSAYDDESRVPICSGSCGHTFGCRACNDRLWATNSSPNCPVCRSDLVDVAPNYELLRILSAAKGQYASTAIIGSNEAGPSSARGTGMLAGAEDEDGDYVKLERLSWIEAPELIYTANQSSVVYSGRMDGEVVGIRVEVMDSDKTSMFITPSTVTERNLTRLRSLRGPHIVQLYGVSRTAAPDNRLIAVTELPTGGTLANNMSLLSSQSRVLSAGGTLMLCLQLIRALQFLHKSNISAGCTLSPNNIAISLPIATDWTTQHRLKFLDLGGSISKLECCQDIKHSFPSTYASYLAPEVLDEDRSHVRSRDSAFKKLTLSDMYSLGVLLWEITCGQKPFEGLRATQIVAAVVGRGERPGFPPSTAPEELQTLISRLWSQNPEDRPTASEACGILETVPSAPPP